MKSHHAKFQTTYKRNFDSVFIIIIIIIIII